MAHVRGGLHKPSDLAPHASLRQVAPVHVRPPSAAVLLQHRLGNEGSQRWLAQVQRASAISSPHDPAELEAHAVASRVVRTPDASVTPVDAKASQPGLAQRAPLMTPAAPAATVALPSGAAAGTPLPSPVRGFMEPRFGASFANVRIHTDEGAAQLSNQLNAQAFTVGENVYFGKDQYRPDSEAGRELIAHELTHTVQQGASVQRGVVHRSAQVAVAQQVSPQVQRSWLGIADPREYFAGKARAIPGFTMLTVVIGFNPITNARVDRSAGNILRGAIEMIPGGSLITDALNAHGVFDKASAWAASQFDVLKDIGAGVWQDIENFIKKFSITDLRDPGGLWDQAKAIVERPIGRIKAFATSLKDGIVALVKEAILKPVAAFAQKTSGYPLLCAVMGKDPITGEAVVQDAESLLGAFMKFIGEEEIWTNMQKANAVPRAFAWFKGALSAVRGFVNEIPGLFVQAFHKLEVADIILIPRAFMKLAGVFGGFAVRFVTWGAEAAWKLLEIIFDVVSPGALAYIKKTGAALKSILKNPLPFVGNLVKTAKLGFLNFADHLLDHLKAGLINWLTGSLPGIYIPKAFSLVEIAKFVFSVLGLSWANIRQKLVKATSENVVKAMETGFDIVKTLVRDGPAAAWDKIKEQLSNLKDMVIGGITDFVVDMVVKKAIPKLIAMFIPGAGFISAILSIYDTVMVFVNKIKEIAQVVTGFIDSIVAIAGGAIGAAATKVESTLAGGLSLAINFLAGFAGLGKVADKVMGVINKIRAPIDKALDWLVNFVVTGAKSAGKFVIGKAQSATGLLLEWWKKEALFSDKKGKSHRLFFSGQGAGARLKVASAEMFTEEFVAKVEKVFDEDPLAKSFGLTYLNRCVQKRREVDNLKTQLESEKKANSLSAKFTEEKLQDAMRELAGNMGPLFDVLPENKVEDLPAAPGAFVTIPYRDAERKAEILFASKERVNYEIKSASSKLQMPTPVFKQKWAAGEIRPYVEKGAREVYLGDTPGKASATGKSVIARYKTDLDKNNVVIVEWQPGKWWPLSDCDMSHEPVDAVTYWNSVRQETSPKSARVRAWMLEPKNYILEPSALNRSRGARVGDKYLPP